MNDTRMDVRSGAPGLSDEKLKEAFRALHHHRDRLRHRIAYEQFVRDHPWQAAWWQAQFEDEREQQEQDWKECAEKAVAKLRSSRRDASSLVIAFCMLEGLDPLVVADAILPPANEPPRGNTHPWMPTGSPEHRANLTTSACTMRWLATRENRVILRQDPDPRGAACIDQRGKRLELDCTIGSAHLRTTNGVAILTINGAIPDTLLAAALGRPVSDIVSHPLIMDPDYRITSTRELSKMTRIEFACANVPWPPADVRTKASPPRLHVDPIRPAAEIVQDLADRIALGAMVNDIEPDANALLWTLRREVARNNLAAPRMSPLPEPTIEQIHSAIATAWAA